VDVGCGYLVVPENRREGGAGTVRLHYAVFRSTATQPEPDPVVYLSGGPGFGVLATVPFTFLRRFSPFLAKRDFIMFDQRGTGFSEPSLACPEYTSTFYDTLDEDLSAQEMDARTVAAVLTCHDRLAKEGIDLGAYSSVESAADLRDLRLALGYKRWNLYGISYGTKLALTTMRDYPEGIRSAILDSTYPLQVSLDTSIAANARRAFDLLFQACKDHAPNGGRGPSCGDVYPGLEASLFRAVEALNQAPVPLSITHPLTGQTFPALLNGDGLIRTVFNSLYVT
jgi:pimeloyl-ACP methyl ester carboxylesterase